MKAGSASLLRLRPVTWARVALLAALVCTVPAPAALAASPVPDPSPLGGSTQPDPFPAVHREPTAVAPRTVPRATIHLTPVAPAAPVTTPVAPPAKYAAHTTRHVIPTAKRNARPAHTHVTPKRAALAPVAALRIFDDPVARATVLAAGAVDQPRRVSPTLALALGLLVLVSAGFVAVAAREMAL